jgi:hypothetical protein
MSENEATFSPYVGQIERPDYHKILRKKEVLLWIPANPEVQLSNISKFKSYYTANKKSN